MTDVYTINDSLIESVVTALARGDNNAALSLEILEEDGCNIGELALAKKDGLPVYTLSILYDRPHAQQKFFEGIFSKSIASVGRRASLVPAFSCHPEKTADLMDVIFAILSESPSALSNLIDTYNKMGIKVGINEPAIESENTEGFRNKDARKLRPLDFVVQLYVAQRIAEAPVREKRQMYMDALKSQLGPLKEFLGISGLKVEAIELNGPATLGTKSQYTENDIRLLLSLGAEGSKEVYFPTDERSLVAPFDDVSGFEVTSLIDFCRQNRAHFSDEIFIALTKSSQRGLVNCADAPVPG